MPHRRKNRHRPRHHTHAVKSQVLPIRLPVLAPLEGDAVLPTVNSDSEHPESAASPEAQVGGGTAV